MPMLEVMKASFGSGTTAKERFFRSKAEAYDGLEQTLGVSPAEDSELDEPLYKTEELQGRGLIFRITCRLENGKRAEVFCVREKLQTALDELPGKSMNGSEIKSAIISRKARFS